MNRNSGPVCAALLCLVMALPLCAAEPGADGIQLDVVPQSLELTSCEQSSSVLIIARNPTSQAASALQITSFSDVPVQLSPTPAVKALAPGQQTSWQFEVKCTSDFASGYLHIVLSDKLARGGRTQVAQIATKSVAIKLREPQTLENIAAIDIKTTLESLTKGDEGQLLVTVTNKMVQPIRATITPTAPKFITLDPKARDVKVDALRTEMFPFTATANGQVSPGKQLLIFQIQLATSKGKRDFLITREVNVGILGGSEILKLLGVPSLLFLPGFLFVSSFMLLWRWKVLRPVGADSPPLEETLAETKSGFWVVSITLSLIMSGTILLVRKNFFSFYGLGDLTMLWMVSIVIGCGTYVAYRRIANEIARRERLRQEQARQARYPQPSDSQVQILHKLKQFGQHMELSRVKLKKKADSLFLLWNEDGAAYVCPEMVLMWKEDADPAVRTIVQDQLKTGGDPGIVADALDAEEAKRNTGGVSGIAELRWNSADPLHSTAHKIAETDIEYPAAAKDIILRETN